MVDTARDDTLMSVSINDYHISQFYLIGNHHHCVAFQLIGGV